jgi:hypothetical protein
MSKNGQKGGTFLGKTPFLNPFLHFFKKIEFIRRKIVQINMFPEGIKKSAKIGKKKKGSSKFFQKICKNGQKGGTFFWAKLHF